jgi:hypothetical protein
MRIDPTEVFDAGQFRICADCDGDIGAMDPVARINGDIMCLVCVDALPEPEENDDREPEPDSEDMEDEDW